MNTAKTVSLLGLLLGLLAPHPASANPTKNVTLNNFKFSPKTLVITPGTTVKWKHSQSGGVIHDIDSDDGHTFASPDLEKGQSFSHKFKKKGTFRYHCNFHGAAGGVGMAGTIKVKS